MLWRGQRQSVNIYDLSHGVNSITVSWFSSNQSAKVVIDTDGTAYSGNKMVGLAEIIATDINIAFVESNQSYADKNKWPMALTEGQKATLSSIVRQIAAVSSTDKVSILGATSDGYLVEYLADLLHNN